MKTEAGDTQLWAEFDRIMKQQQDRMFVDHLDLVVAGVAEWINVCDFSNFPDDHPMSIEELLNTSFDSWSTVSCYSSDGMGEETIPSPSKSSPHLRNFR